LHSLIVRDRKDVARILKFLCHVRGRLRKLILERCWLGKDGNVLLLRIVELCPDLEVLSLEGCHPLTSGYRLSHRIPEETL